MSEVTRSPEVNSSDQSLGSMQNMKRKCRTKATPARRSASPRLASSRNTGARRDGVAKMAVTTIAFSVAMTVPDTQRATPHTVRGGTLCGGALSAGSMGKKVSAPEDSSQPRSEALRIMVIQQPHSLKQTENTWYIRSEQLIDATQTCLRFYFIVHFMVICFVYLNSHLGLT